MPISLLSISRISLFVTFALGAMGGASSPAASIESGCTRAPALSYQIAGSPELSAMLTSRDRYRVSGIRWDPILNQRWAMISSCNHPERPSISVLLTNSRQSTSFLKGDVSAQSPFPVVHAGDLVQLWSQEQNFRIEIAGRVEQNGAAGNKVRVRMLHSGFDAGQTQTTIGIVRGPGNVEILR